MSNPPILMSMVQASSAGSQPNGWVAFIIQSFPLLAIFVIFYVLWIRPQQRRVKDHQAAVAAVKKGDEVITAGGIRGRVTKVGDEQAGVELAQGGKGRVAKATLTKAETHNRKPAHQ